VYADEAGTYDYTYITVGRSHGCRGNAKYRLDSKTSPTQLGYNLFICQGCKMLQAKHQNSSSDAIHNTHPVGPCVDTDVMPGHVLFDKNLRAFDDTGSNNEKGSQEILPGEVPQQFS
jgi:hypothetical protein